MTRLTRQLGLLCTSAILSLSAAHADPFFSYSALPNDAGLPRQEFYPHRAVVSHRTPVAKGHPISVALLDRNSAPAAYPQREAASQSLPATPGAGPMVPGSRAEVRHGIAYAPADAPDSVKRAIWAVNSITRKPYRFGGGHGSFYDAGYDCSGSVSFALHGAGLIATPLDSRSLMSYGEPGRGRWVTIYARSGHTFANVAGLRLDTTGFYGNEGPRWRTDARSPWGFTPRHPAGL